MLTILDGYCENGLNHDHLTIENLPYKSLWFSSGSKRLEPDTKYSDLVRTMSAFNCLYLVMFHIELKLINSNYFKAVFQNLNPKLKYSKSSVLVTSSLFMLAI